MTPHRILQLNAAATAACAVAVLAARRFLPPLFGLDTPILLDAIAVGFLAYAGVLAFAARQRPVSRQALMFFTAADAAWVAASAILLVLFWEQFAPLARFLVIAVGLAVEVLATLQFRAAGGAAGASPRMA